MHNQTDVSALLLSAALLLPFGSAFADHAPKPNDPESARIEEIIVSGQQSTADTASIAAEREPTVDAGSVLKRLPGADINRNGALSGIAQYRGMYGDRVHVAIDGIGLIGGGPNAMDSPLSYVSPMITESLTVQRGIASVDTAAETIGGHVEATLDRGHFTETGDFGIAGMAGARYSDNASTTSTAARLTAANDRHRFTFVGQADRGNDIDTPEGRIIPSELARDRYDLSYGFEGGTGEWLVYTGWLDTTDTGTPALAMDIRYIETRLYGVKWRRALGESVTISADVGYNDVDHLMDNFSLRTRPASPMQYRQNRALGEGTIYAVSAAFDVDAYTIKAGIDGRIATHDAVITNPNNSMFVIDNFNDVSRDVLGGFAMLESDGAVSRWELGVRYTDVSTDAGEVSATGLMDMMGMNAAMLAGAFNAADRRLSFGNVSAVFKYSHRVSDELRIGVDVGSKTRAPSYQELYLWLPLQATGGLADGRSYIGNLGLDAERSNEVAMGFDWTGDRFSLSPQVYFKDVADYIQGVPATSMPANMLASMMSGSGALQFSNVAAEIYGVDVGWHYLLGDRLRLEGTASYSRGRRTDVDDNLYRLPPLNASLALNYAASRWSLRGEVVGYDAQEHVSAYNAEQPTAGYTIVNGLFSWNASDSLRFDVQALNLFNESYQDHLAGVNRVIAADLPVGERLFGAGRTITVGAVLTF